MENVDNGQHDGGMHTVPSEPPEPERSQRRSVWGELFDECRSHPGQWRRTKKFYTASTAGQLASDIRNGPSRDPKKARIRGLKGGERWETRWGLVDEIDGVARFAVWLKYLGN